MVDVWQQCDGQSHMTNLEETAWRVVEAQEATSTRKLVDSLDEQALLEQMIEETKPSIPTDCQHLHPLLYTPFRYPPLLHGSRFGRKHERSLWYASLQLRTTFAEVAFYRFHFLRASDANYGVVSFPLTAFSIKLKTVHGIYLTRPPFTEYTEQLSSPISYQVSQQIGTAMRHAGVAAFTYQSARDIEHGNNIAVLTPNVFANSKPNRHSLQSWQGIADHRTIEFMRTSTIDKEAFSYPIKHFLVAEELPFPAE